MSDALSDAANETLQAIYDVFATTGRWPTFQQIDRHLDRERQVDIAKVLPTIPRDLLRLDQFAVIGSNPAQVLELSVRGVALCTGAEPDIALFISVLRWCAQKEKAFEPSSANPDEQPTASAEQFHAEHDDQLAEVDLLKVGALLRQEGRVWIGASNSEQANWTFTLSREIRHFRGLRDFADYCVRVNERDEPAVHPAPPVAIEVANLLTDNASEFDFEVALSFAGEDRTYAHRLAMALQASGVRVFYDEFAEAETWGADLLSFFDDVFRKKARFAIALVSRYYAAKVWPRFESRSAQARALYDDNYFLPLRLDDTELPGLLPTVGYVDGRQVSIEHVVALVLRKLGTPSDLPQVARPLSVPFTSEQADALLAERPDGWEYLLYAGLLWQGSAALEQKWHDHRLRMINRDGQRVLAGEIGAFLKAAMADASRAMSSVEHLFTPEAQAAAFGAPGEPGDPGRIYHLASRFNSGIYELLLDWAMALRSAIVPHKYRRAVDLAAALADQPLNEIRAFVDQLVASCQQIPAHMADPDPPPLRIEVRLTLTIADDAMATLNQEMRRLPVGRRRHR